MTPATADWQQYLCQVCGLVYDEALGDPDSGIAPGTRFADIPDDWACPICGVGKADFVLHDAAAAQVAARAAAQAAGERTRAAPAASRGPGLVVVGAGRAGWQLVQTLRDAGFDRPITLVSACSGDVYDKPQLSVAVARGVAPGALVREGAASAATRLGVRLLADTHAVAIDATGRRLRTTRGTLRWQQLVLAQGAAPVLPPPFLPGQVWQINDLAAYRQLRTRLAGGAQHLAIVGAGLVGCELANDLALAGHAVTLLDLQDLPLAAQLPAEAGRRLLAAWAGLPIRFIGGVRVAALRRCPPAGQRPAPWQLDLDATDGRAQAHAPELADQVIVATGLRTPGRLAASAGLAFDTAAGGIVVNAATGASSAAGIYALGDCVVVDGRASRYIAPIAQQAAAIAAHILGRPAPGPAAGGAPLLRVKTSALPITLQAVAGTSGSAPGTWRTDQADADSLRMARHDHSGRLLATLVAQRPSRSA